MAMNLLGDMRAYIGAEGIRRAAGIAVGTALVALLSPVVLTHLAPNSGTANVSPVLRDPFTVAAWIMLGLSQLSFELMTYRINRLSEEMATPVDPMHRHGLIPETYRRAFGIDPLVVVWNCRFLSVALFAVAVVRWFVQRPSL